MAEENILTCNQAKLSQILSDIKEYNSNKDRLEKLSASIKDLSKELDGTNKEKQTEIDSKIKASTDAICAGYDKSIEDNKNKIKAIQSDRDKAKLAGVKERIEEETASLRNENEDLLEQIKEGFLHENISTFCNKQLFISLFIAKRAVDFVIDILIIALLFVAIPAALYLVPVIPNWVAVIYLAFVGIISLIVNKCVYRNIILPHKEVILSAQDTRNHILSNKEKIKKIEKSIKSDKNEDMYDLGEFDTNINSLYDDNAKIEAHKQEALKDFEDNTKQDIITEIDERFDSKIEDLKSEISKKQDEFDKLDARLKKQRIYISSNYEAYLGKEFTTEEKLTELLSIMKSGSADTIAQAVAICKNRR